MRFTVVAVAFVVTLAAVRQQQTPPFRGGVNIVEVAVSVLDGGQPVRGLTAKDFSVRDDGTAQTIDELVAEDVPLAVTFVLDLSGQIEVVSKGPAVIAAVNDAAKALRPQDRIRILSIQNAVREALPWTPGGAAVAVPPMERGWSVLNDGLGAAFLSARGAIPRPVIVVLTAAVDVMGVVSYGHLDALARSSDAVLFAVVPFVPKDSVDVRLAPSGTPEQAAAKAFKELHAGDFNGINELRNLARLTGGETFEFDATMSGLPRAINAVRGSYVLRFQPHDARKPGWHELDVRVNRGRYNVRSRRGYLVPTSGK